MSQDIATLQERRVLRYLRAVHPESAALADLEYYAALDKASPYYEFADLSYFFGQNHVKRMIRYGWLRQSQRGVQLTKIGEKLADVLEGSDAPKEFLPAPESLVLSPNDPLNYFQLSNLMKMQNVDIIVDPYFRVDNLTWLLQHTDVTRVITSVSGADLEALRSAISQARALRSIEIRSLGKGKAHDRVFTNPENKVWVMGASINGLGVHTTAVTPLSEEASQQFMLFVEQLWKEAEEVQPLEALTFEPQPEEAELVDDAIS